MRVLEDAGPYCGNSERLRALMARDGFLFVRGLVPPDLVAALRARVLGYARRIGWLGRQAPIEAARAAPGKRVGCYHDPDWVNLQVDVQTAPEIWALGECAAIRRVLHAIADRPGDLTLSTANTVRVFSPHPDMATPPHQDAHYVRTLGEFRTVWLPLGDCPRALGPLALLAGSHRGGLHAHAGEGAADACVAVSADAVWSTADFRCGDAALFGPYTVHRTLPNESGDRLRLSADFRYAFWDAASSVDWRASAVRPSVNADG
jgi:ectoine hydroxylase-related dioxygenase (phytanoyl-CoA dioxygenase family)